MLANKQGLGQVHFVEEVVSGKQSWRDRKISTVLGELKQGDSIVVSELSRLGRSMLEIMEILSIALRKGIKIYAVKGEWHLDKKLQSKIVAMAFSIAAEIERDLISQRTQRSVESEKAAGVSLGRPKGPGKSKLDPYRPEIEALLNNGATKKFIAERYNTTPGNLYHWLNKHGIEAHGQGKSQ